MPSQSESEPEKPPLCHSPPPQPPVLAEMSGDHALSSANETSEDVDEEDEFGYSWSKLSVSNALTCKRYQTVHSSGSLKAYAPDG